MKTLFCLLPFAFCLSAFAATPPLPPLPPGYKFPAKRTAPAKGAEMLTSVALLEAMRFVPAAVGPSTNGVLFNPFVYVDPDPFWGKLAVASAHQGTNTILRVKYATSINGERKLVTELACYHVDQTFWVSTTGNLPELYMFGENIPCTPTSAFVPASAPKLGAALDFYTREFVMENGRRVEKRVYLGKGAEVTGLTLPPGFKVWKKMP